MNIEHFFKSLKDIQPNEAYTLRSRALIVGSSIGSIKAPTVRQFLLQSFQFVSAVGLSLVLLVLVGGGFSGHKVFTPSPVAGLDALGIEAEAQAVDVQIRLSGVGYTDPVRISSPASVIPAKRGSLSVKAKVAPEDVVTSTPQGVDEALQALLE